ncbi:MAG: hypothetical protein ABEJ66_02230, partial [Candidatus Nanohaloarchaea archaeon]
MGVEFKDKVSMFQTAASIDQGAEEEFLNKLDSSEGSLNEPVKITVSVQGQIGDDETINESDSDSLETLAEVSNFFRADARRLFRNVARLSRDIYDIEKGTVELAELDSLELDIPEQALAMAQNNPQVSMDVDYDLNPESIKKTTNEIMEAIWGEGAAGSSDKSELTAQAKLQALSRNLDVQNSTIFEEAQNREEPDVEQAAKAAFSKPENDDILKNLTQGRIRDDFNKESSIFFHIIPAWMQTAEFSDEEGKHEGWSVPKFIWRNILRESIDRSDEFEDPYFESWEKFEEFLEEDRRNQLNVIAAVAACYLWGHFTQKEDTFEGKAFEQTVRRTDAYEPPLDPDDEEDAKWIEWMNRFGLKVNLEAMFGSPGELRRLWRPKDIAVACHAINLEASQQLDDYDENLVKFTIDMEHTASYGV